MGFLSCHPRSDGKGFGVICQLESPLSLLPAISTEQYPMTFLKHTVFLATPGIDFLIQVYEQRAEWWTAVVHGATHVCVLTAYYFAVVK